MGIDVTENIISSVGAILKTLECPICLELLKTPVSAGCGHFFCKHCVTGILQSKYRAPCPLCKRSFTRRSVQTASQRQSVISAARTLAQTCSILTGFNFHSLESSVKEVSRSSDTDTPNPSKKFRASTEKENAPSRKRKSVESEDVERSQQKSVSEIEMETCAEPAQDDVSSKKRACSRFQSEDEDSEDLPSLEDVFSQLDSFSKSPVTPIVKEPAAEKPLSIFPTDRKSSLKTYSSIHRQKEKSVSSVESKLKETKEGYDDYFISDKNNAISGVEPSPKSCQVVQKKNKINALKNKTNEVYTEKVILEGDSVSKLANVKNSNDTAESANKSKENEIIAIPLTPSAVKTKQPGIKKLRKSKRRNEPRLQNPSSKNISSDVQHENSLILDEIALPSLEWQKQNEQTTEKSAEDPFKSMGLTDTAVSVDSVGSPMAAKALSLLKSPGWSRVKEVKKDFKVKKFTSLHVEKNSPNISLKNVHCQETSHVSEIPEPSTSVQKCRSDKTDSDHENEVMKMNTPFSPNYECSIDQQLGQQSVLIREKNTLGDELNSQNANVPEPINEVNEFDSQMEVDKEMNATSDNNMNNYKNVQSTKSLNTDVVLANTNPDSPKLPTVSFTANSVICANFTDTSAKMSQHNVVKTKKIICGMSNNTIFDDDLTKGDILSKYMQHNGSEADNVLLNNSTEIKQGAFPAHISGYQSFQAQSVINEDDGFHYVEQSQQTSQLFNLDLQNCALNKLNPIAQPCILLNHATKEKTKVIKRTCLTLDEIQDCFLKSSQSNCSETLCSVPFLDGLFKLHIGVSDDTLNVSVLKVIQPSSETHDAQSALMNKYIQTTNSLLLPAILPSSNAGSESSQPDSAADPFPNLNKVSGSVASNQDLLHSTEKCVVQSESSHFLSRSLSHAETSPRMTEMSYPEKIADQPGCDDEINENNMDMSEIIHFPAEPAPESAALPEKFPDSSETVEQIEVGQVVKSPVKEDAILTVEQSPLKSEDASMKCNLTEKEYIHLPEEELVNLPEKENIDLPVKEGNSLLLNSDNFSSSDEEFDLKKLEQCLQASKGGRKKVSRLSLKKKSLKRTQVLESTDESDLENDHTLGVVNKSPTKVNNNVSVKCDKTVKRLSPTKNSTSPILDKVENSKSITQHRTTGEAPSTFNSILSEDVTETNASEIILEIEDLADKIKSLEEKLKQCGHADLQKSLNLPQTQVSKPQMVHENSDSEDSFDLFPQSVPPTPPSRV